MTTNTTTNTTTGTFIPYNKPVQEGWRCPQCGAVMSPWTSFCVNCRGNTITPSVFTTTSSDKYDITQVHAPYTELTAQNQSDAIKDLLTDNLNKFSD